MGMKVRAAREVTSEAIRVLQGECRGQWKKVFLIRAVWFLDMHNYSLLWKDLLIRGLRIPVF